MEFSIGGQVVVNALLSGLIYALIALGITLIFSILIIINFAHGSILMLGAFIPVYVCTKLGQNYFLALLLAVVITGLLGFLLEKGLFRSIRARPLQCVVVSMGLMLLIDGGALLLFGPRSYGVEEIFAGSLQLGGIFIPGQRLFVISISIILIAALNYFLKNMKHGQAMRALSQDRQAAVLQGISIDRMAWMGFAIGCALAGAAGALLAPVFYVSFGMGGNMILKGFIVMIIGGLGSIPGALVGGLIVGVIESIGYTFLPGGWTTVILFALIVIFLLVRPQGVMGYEVKL